MEILEEKQSDLITAIRFPLIILVVFIHTLPSCFFQYPTIFENVDLYRIISKGISCDLALIAVPCFFLISGFLFFKRIDAFTTQVYTNQLKKRIWTLLVPYLLWNAIFIGVILLKNYFFMKLGAKADDGYKLIHHQSIIKLFWTADGPINYPLWYVRDLICMVVLTPVFYIYCRYFGVVGLFFLVLIHVSGFNTNIPGLHADGLTYFGMGAYLALHKKNIAVVFTRFRYPCLAGAVLFGILAYCYIGSVHFTKLNRVYIFFGVITFFNAINYMILNINVKNCLMKLSSPVFFIYCTHIMYLTGGLKGFFSRSPLTHSEWGVIVIYFSLPCAVLGICIILHQILCRIFPSVMNVLLGERK